MQIGGRCKNKKDAFLNLSFNYYLTGNVVQYILYLFPETVTCLKLNYTVYRA
jgi:hypothetical protein